MLHMVIIEQLGILEKVHLTEHVKILSVVLSGGFKDRTCFEPMR